MVSVANRNPAKGPSWALLLLQFLVFSAVRVVHVGGCTDILVTPGASADGSAMIAYNADSVTLYGVLYHYPASNQKQQQQAAAAVRHIYEWDTGVYLGQIPETTNATYNVVGNSNEHGLVIGETTFGGVPVLDGKKQRQALGAILDYGSLIYLTLQRAKTAREAMHTMVELMDTYGYVSEGESFSIADRSGEVWMMEVISRGDSYGQLGAVWVALKIPDGYVGAHANQARIATFPRDDPDHCLYADDVVDVAVHYGLFPATADPNTFSFSDVYNPVHFISARMSEARVWSMFSTIADRDGTFEQKYLDYASGANTKHRMPLFIKPFAKLSATDVMRLMTSHYEGTALDPTLDVGAGVFAAAYRPRPLVWQYQGKTYHNERTLATPRTGWSFVAQIRPWMPPPLAALVWFAADDSSTSPRIPVYGSNTAVPEPYAGKGSQDGVLSPLLKFDTGKAFWVQNMVSNFCYYRWNDAYPVVRNKIEELQRNLLQLVHNLDDKALELYKQQGAKQAVQHVTNATVHAGEIVHQEWLNFYGELFVRFRDFHTITSKPDDPLCSCEAKEAGLSDAMKRRIVDETGSHYQVNSDTFLQEEADHATAIV